MKKLFFLFIIPASFAKAQPSYLVTYHYSISHNLLAVQGNLANVTMTQKDSVHPIMREAEKVIFDNFKYTVECSSNLLVGSRHPKFEQDTVQSEPGAYLSGKVTGAVEVVDLKTYEGFIRGLENFDKARCWIIDTARLHFKRLNKKRKIGEYSCEAFVPVGDDGVTVWTCKDLPYYVNPLLFGPELPGGVVEVDFKNNGSRILLIRTEKIEAVTSYEAPPCAQKEKYDLLYPHLRKL